jgi:hypothetical protein
LNPGGHFKAASISQIIPKLTRSASFGHDGIARPLATFPGDISLTYSLLVAATWLVPHIATVARHTPGGQGHMAPSADGHGHLQPGPMALLIWVVRADALMSEHSPVMPGARERGWS